MKKLMIYLCLGTILSARANNLAQMDTIYANTTMTTALFFPSEIKQGITGTDNFVFTYNREKEQNLGLLKAAKGAQSNLLVITADGSIYSFILKYSEHLENPNRFISIHESIGNVKQIQKKGIKVDSAQVKNLPTIVHRKLFSKSCESFLKLPNEKNVGKTKAGIRLCLKNLKYQGDYVFLKFEIENTSGIRFDFDHLKISKVNGNKKRNASYQEIPLIPLYIHNKPAQILPNHKTTVMVYVVPKFIIEDHEKMEVKLQELNTTRAVYLHYK